MAAKEPAAPTVKERLAVVEALIAREEAGILGEKGPNVEDVLVQEGEEGDMRQALSRVEVRRVFFRLFKLGGLMEADSDPNQIVMAHHVGRRSMALDLYKAICKVDPGAYWQMEREHASDLKSKQSKSKEKPYAD